MALGNQDVELERRVVKTAQQITNQTTAAAPAFSNSSAILLTTLLTDFNALGAAYNALRTDHNALVSKVNDVLAKLRAGELIAP